MVDIVSGDEFKAGVKQAQAEFRREVSRLASLANKRIQRLENAKLTDSPAYQKWVENGSVKFGVKGKTYNQLQSEMARLNRFINAQTSTVRGINSNLKEMAANTGIKYGTLKELRAKATSFFELASKVEQYLRTVNDMASAIGYNKIWEVINEYVEKEKIDLSGAENNINELSKMVSELIVQQQNHNATVIDDGWVVLE
jgi:predicted RNase H-like nuclease (RuvC/YqgF family)